MNIVTIVFRGDIANLLYQASSLRKHWKEDIKKWYIIVEDSHVSDITINWVKTQICPRMNGWEVVVIDKNDKNFPKMNLQGGWYRQQLLKLWAASELSDTEYSLILDAKNFLCYPIDSAWFFQGGKLKVQVHAQDNLSEPWLMCCDFFKKDPNLYVRPFNLTPWVLKKDLVKNTIEQYSNHGVDIFKSKLLPAWEFEAYFLCNQNNFKWIKVDMLDGLLPGYRKNKTAEFLLDRIHLHRQAKKPFWTFHRYEHFNKRLRPLSDSYLKECGIIDDELIRQWQLTTNKLLLEWPELLTCKKLPADKFHKHP